MVAREQVEEVLKKVNDPEIQIDIWSLGLVYNIEIEGNKVKILMTFTSPMCPYGPALLDDVRRQISAIDGVGEVVIDLTFNPVWGPEKMSEEAKIALGINY
ncbi:metal-sulfur cluster assembly factor [Candidatus Woesearchaeota archaeon]|nr:metal-sulfur cluster assembly factor [Candidatus Woesearchaeota archaeon]